MLHFFRQCSILVLLLQTSIDFSLNGTSLEQVLMERLSEVAKFDFSITFVYNPTFDDDDDILSCSFVCSHDIFEETTVTLKSLKDFSICSSRFLRQSQ